MKIVLATDGEPVADAEALALCRRAIEEGISGLVISTYNVVQAMQYLLAREETPFGMVELEAYGNRYIINTYGAILEEEDHRGWHGSNCPDICQHLATEALFAARRRAAEDRRR